jgi:hypothetical protein
MKNPFTVRKNEIHVASAAHANLRAMFGVASRGDADVVGSGQKAIKVLVGLKTVAATACRKMRAERKCRKGN